MVLVLVAAACSPGEDSTTSSGEGTTTTVESVPTSSRPTTTTSTSTSTAPTTLAPTTTTTLLEGNWADQPVITGSTWEGVLGWWDGSGWVQAEDGSPVPVSGGEDYRIVLLGVEATTTGSARVKACDIFGPDYDFPGVELDDPDLLTRDVEGEDPSRSVIRGVAISAPWNLTPREVVAGEMHPEIETAAAQVLGERGYEADDVAIVQIVDADFDGDGTVETVVVAEDTELANQASDVYSVVFVLSPAFDGASVVEESIIPAGQSGFPASFRVSAVADLSGDGVMEVVLDGLAWENSWSRVYEKVGDRFESRISAGCGV
ncbi:MAG TPA: hypothetical protein VFS66_09290 [Acidimicrobiia bacterium]|nr:hypothetical protein [Acidimicrobiia bacterium]